MYWFIKPKASIVDGRHLVVYEVYGSYRKVEWFGDFDFDAYRGTFENFVDAKNRVELMKDVWS